MANFGQAAPEKVECPLIPNLSPNPNPAFVERRRTVPPIGGMLNQSLARRILMEIRQFLFVQGARADLAGVESVARQAQFVARTRTFSRPYGTQWSESFVFDPGTEVAGLFSSAPPGLCPQGHRADNVLGGSVTEALRGPLKAFQNRGATVLLEAVVDRSRCEALEVAHDGVKLLGGRRNQVYVVGHDCEGKEPQILVAAAEAEAVEDWVDVASFDQHGEPVEDGDRAEVGGVFGGSITEHVGQGSW